MSPLATVPTVLGLWWRVQSASTWQRRLFGLRQPQSISEKQGETKLSVSLWGPLGCHLKAPPPSIQQHRLKAKPSWHGALGNTYHKTYHHATRASVIILLSFVLIFWDRISPCSPGWPRAYYVDQAGFKFASNPLASVPRLLRFQTKAIIPIAACLFFFLCVGKFKYVWDVAISEIFQLTFFSVSILFKTSQYPDGSGMYYYFSHLKNISNWVSTIHAFAL